MPTIRHACLLSVAVVAALASTSPARAADPQACVTAYEEGQRLRSTGALGAAKEQFLVCADPGCPSATKGDCTTWVAEVDQSMPTLIFAVTDKQGNDTTAVKVTVDGKLLLTSLDGKGTPVDPGAHKVVVEIEGEAPVEQELVVREGEKNRKVEVSFAPAGGAAPQASSGGGSISPWTWVLGGVGVAGLGVFGAFGAIGLSEKSDAEDTCAPNCSDDDVSSIRTKFIVGDIGLGVGVAGLAAAVVVGIVSASSGDDGADAAAALPFRVGGGPMPGGGFAAIEGSF